MSQSKELGPQEGGVNLCLHSSLWYIEPQLSVQRMQRTRPGWKVSEKLYKGKDQANDAIKLSVNSRTPF